MSDLGDKIVREITSRKLKPKPLAVFLAKRAVYWTLGALALLCASLAVAFGLFAVFDMAETGGKGIDEMPFDDAAVLLPLVALLALVAFAASAIFNYRQTPKGYRLRPVTGFVLAVMASATLGLILHGASVGSAINDFLVRMSPAYAEYITIPYAEWSHPDKGMLGGTAIELRPNNQLQLRDFNGKEWVVDIGEATINLDESPVREGDVAIRGVVTGPGVFKATSVDPFD